MIFGMSTPVELTEKEQKRVMIDNLDKYIADCNIKLLELENSMHCLKTTAEKLVKTKHIEQAKQKFTAYKKESKRHSTIMGILDKLTDIINHKQDALIMQPGINWINKEIKTVLPSAEALVSASDELADATTELADITAKIDFNMSYNDTINIEGEFEEFLRECSPQESSAPLIKRELVPVPKKTAKPKLKKKEAVLS